MFNSEIQAHIKVIEQLSSMELEVNEVVNVLVDCLEDNGKILICGNGGSAGDAQHFAAELVGRFKKERRALAAVALSTDSSIITAIGNDYSFDKIFSRQVEAIARPNDVLFGISTSGNSPNVVQAVCKSREIGLKCLGLLGNQGGKLAMLMDQSLIVPSDDTARIQEAHIFILHYLACRIENEMMK